MSRSPLTDFADEFGRLLKKLYNWDCTFDEATATLLVNFGDKNGAGLPMKDFFARFLAAGSPDKEIQELAKHAYHMLEIQQQADSWKDFAACRSRLMPIVRTFSDVQQSAIQLQTLDSHAALTHRRLTDRLVVGVAVDQPQTICKIGTLMLKEWGVDFDTVYEIALANLRARTESLRWKRIGDGVWRSPWNDYFDASRILIPETMQCLQAMKNPALIVAATDAVYAVNDTGPASIQSLVATSTSRGQSRDRRVSHEIVTFEDGKLIPYTRSAYASELNREGGLQERIQDWAEQQDVWQHAPDLSDFKPIDADLARAPNNELCTASLWTVGESNPALPVTDYVGILDKNFRPAPFFVKFSDFASALGTDLAITDITPPRALLKRPLSHADLMSLAQQEVELRTIDQAPRAPVGGYGTAQSMSSPHARRA